MAEITPNGVVGPGLETPFEVTFTEVGSSTLGSALLLLPAGFSKGSDDTLTVTTSADGEAGPGWEAFWTELNSALAIALAARDDEALLETGGWVSLGFKALTPQVIEGEAESFTFTTRAWTDRAGETLTDEEGQSNVNNPAHGDYPGGSYDYRAQELTVTVSEAITGALGSAAVEPGHTVYVHPGTYREDLTITKENLTLAAVEENTVVIEGTVNHAAEGINLVGITVTDPAEFGMMQGMDGVYHAGTAVSIPDPNLEAAIRNVLGKPVGDITVMDMKMLIALNASSRSIADLTGLEYAVNLWELSLWDNQISNLMPLSGLNKLEWLGLGGNQISDITPLTGLSKLKGLHLDFNQISDLAPLTGLTTLTWLNLWNNQVSNLTPLADLTDLQSLNLQNNQISDISALAKLTKLRDLDLSNNQISNISVLAGLTDLRDLDLSHNQISDILALSDLTDLCWLDLKNNRISDISALAKLTNLQDLDLSHNQISDISVLGNLTNLEDLDLSHNRISDISAFAGLTNLRWRLDLSHNQISNISALSNLTNLQGLGLSHNRISDISALAGLTNLSNLYLSHNRISDISALAGLTNLRWRLDLSHNLIRNINALNNLTDLRRLDLRYNYINTFPGSPAMAVIHKLQAAGTYVQYLPQRFTWPGFGPFEPAAAGPGGGRPGFGSPGGGGGAGFMPTLPGSVAQALAGRMTTTLLNAVGSGFVSGGTAADLAAARQAYQAAHQQYQAHGEALSAADRAVVETVLEVTWAAILALEARLAAAEGLSFDLEALLVAYASAEQALSANSGYLSDTQLAELTAIMAEISAVIASLGP